MLFWQVFRAYTSKLHFYFFLNVKNLDIDKAAEIGLQCLSKSTSSFEMYSNEWFTLPEDLHEVHEVLQLCEDLFHLVSSERELGDDKPSHKIAQRFILIPCCNGDTNILFQNNS